MANFTHFAFFAGAFVSFRHALNASGSSRAFASFRPHASSRLRRQRPPPSAAPPLPAAAAPPAAPPPRRPPPPREARPGVAVAQRVAHPGGGGRHLAERGLALRQMGASRCRSDRGVAFEKRCDAQPATATAWPRISAAAASAASQRLRLRRDRPRLLYRRRPLVLGDTKSSRRRRANRGASGAAPPPSSTTAPSTHSASRGTSRLRPQRVRQRRAVDGVDRPPVRGGASCGSRRTRSSDDPTHTATGAPSSPPPPVASRRRRRRGRPPQTRASRRATPRSAAPPPPARAARSRRRAAPRGPPPRRHRRRHARAGRRV